MSIDRLYELRAHGCDGFGSACAVAPKLFLTAHHVVDGADRIELNPVRSGPSLEARNGCRHEDVAALQGDDHGLKAVQWGRWERKFAIACRFFGFPRASYAD